MNTGTDSRGLGQGAQAQATKGIHASLINGTDRDDETVRQTGQRRRRGLGSKYASWSELMQRLSGLLALMLLDVLKVRVTLTQCHPLALIDSHS